MKRTERKMTREALTRLEGMRQKDRMLSQEPTKSYRRETIYTSMPWPLKLILMRRTDVLIIIILGYVFIFIVVTLGLYFLIQWLLGVFF